jgi:hypothetical protein
MRERAIRALMKLYDHASALEILSDMPDADPRLVAECLEGVGELEKAAGGYLQAGSPTDALRCYRTIPDFDKTLDLLDSVGTHPARESLMWLRQMRDLAGRRPAEFPKVILPAEKILLEQVLEASLGTSRKKPAAKRAKTAAKTAAKTTKIAKTPAKKAPKPRREEYF